MDKLISLKLDKDSVHYDDQLFRKVGQQARDYIDAGLQSLTYFVCDLDAANDAVQAYAPLLNGFKNSGDFDKYDRVASRNFTLPMTATEITTLATFISQILFGGATSRQVEARNDDLPPAVQKRIDELEKQLAAVAQEHMADKSTEDTQKELDRLRDLKPADLVNELLQWNDDQQDTYLQGYLWAWDCLTFNRGIMYDHWQHLVQVSVEPVVQDLPYTPEIVNGKKQPKPKGWKPEKFTRFKKVKKQVGGYNKIELISPYDFICDPTLPNIRFQDGRFAGHRVMIPWIELKRRSELSVEDYDYVLPATVAKLKNMPSSSGDDLNTITNQGVSPSRSRSYYERMRRGQPAGLVGGTDKINKDDGGVIECWCIQIRTRPKTMGLYDDVEEEKVEVLIASKLDILSVNIQPNVHDQYPYCVGEARPNAHIQFSKSWALIILPIQRYVDYLKQRRMESIARTSGNIFIGDPTKIDFNAFTDPDKDGLFIPIKADASGEDISKIIKQVPVIDTTAKFYEEMEMWIGQAEVATGAHAYVQGQTEDPSQTATQFTGTQQMSTGRISTVARVLAAPLKQQTRRFVRNFQQWMPDQQVIRVTGDKRDFDPEVEADEFMTVKKTDIQFQFDVVSLDGSLPGTDARKVAALSRIIEAADDPAFAECFNDTFPGALSPKMVLFESIKASGIRLRNLVVTKDQAIANLKAKMLAQGLGMGGVPPQDPNAPPGAPPVSPQPPPIAAGPGLAIPSAQPPPTPTAAPATGQ